MSAGGETKREVEKSEKEAEAKKEKTKEDEKEATDDVIILKGEAKKVEEIEIKVSGVGLNLFTIWQHLIIQLE